MRSVGTPDSVYDALSFFVFSLGLLSDEENGMSADAAGGYIASLALRGHLKPEYTVGLKYKFFIMLARLLPCRALSWLVKTIYAK